MKMIRHMARETMNPDNNSRMLAAAIGFVFFCVAISFLRLWLES